MLNFEIEKAVDYYKIPLIIVYTGYIAIWRVGDELENKWTKALKELSMVLLSTRIFHLMKDNNGCYIAIFCA